MPPPRISPLLPTPRNLPRAADSPHQGSVHGVEGHRGAPPLPLQRRHWQWNSWRGAKHRLCREPFLGARGAGGGETLLLSPLLCLALRRLCERGSSFLDRPPSFLSSLSCILHQALHLLSHPVLQGTSRRGGLVGGRKEPQVGGGRDADGRRRLSCRAVEEAEANRRGVGSEGTAVG